MSKPPSFPSMYQVNTRVWLNRLAERRGHPLTLEEVPEAELDGWAQAGFDWVWLLGVWQPSQVGAQLARLDPSVRQAAEALLTDPADEDVCSSCFSIAAYAVSPALGGERALAVLRRRLSDRGIKLLLDFVPNHTAIDHAWLEEHPEFYIEGSEADLAQAPGNYIRLPLGEGGRILAHGRDPNFPGWTDTLQLNYNHPGLQQAMIETLLQLAERCDGLRCDMAMLELPDVFGRTWGTACPPFWPDAIRAVRERHPSFLFLAEVYWDLEARMLREGFDYAYDKRLYDRLQQQRAVPVCAHLRAGLEEQARLTRFLENHDEPRAAAAFALGPHQAAAIVTYLAPGMRFFHQGQLEGWRRQVPVQLCRSGSEATDAGLAAFYAHLLDVLQMPVVRNGQWKLLECHQAWHGNWTWEDFLCYLWTAEDGDRVLAAVNYAGHASQGFVRLPLPDLAGCDWRLVDQMSEAEYLRSGDDLAERGLYLDLPAWGHHVFRLVRG
jgi:hypothetical protein